MSDSKNINLSPTNTLTPGPRSTPSSTPIEVPWYLNPAVFICGPIVGLCLLSLIIGLIAVGLGFFAKNKNSSNKTFVIDNPMHPKGGYFYLD